MRLRDEFWSIAAQFEGWRGFRTAHTHAQARARAHHARTARGGHDERTAVRLFTLGLCTGALCVVVCGVFPVAIDAVGGRRLEPGRLVGL